MSNFNLGLEMPKNNFGYPTVRKVLDPTLKEKDKQRVN